MRRLAIYGAGQHGRVVLALLRQLDGFNTVAFVDDDPRLHGQEISGIPVIGPLEELPECIRNRRISAVFPAVGRADARRRLGASADRLGLELPSLIHPRAIVDPDCRLGRGVLVEAGACLSADPEIADLCIINPCVSVNHDCRLETAAHLAAAVALGGAVQIGENSLLGVGSRVAPGRRVGRNCLVGAGAVVLRDVPDNSTVIGNPGRIQSGGIRMEHD